MRLFVRFLLYFLISDHCDTIKFVPKTGTFYLFVSGLSLYAPLIKSGRTASKFEQARYER